MIAEGTPGQLKASVGAGVMDVRLREFDQRSQAPAHAVARARCARGA
jgi:hypothetical protein